MTVRYLLPGQVSEDEITLCLTRGTDGEIELIGSRKFPDESGSQQVLMRFSRDGTVTAFNDNNFASLGLDLRIYGKMVQSK